MYEGVKNQHERFHVVDDEHIYDTVTGVKVHMYDDWFKMTHADKKIVTMSDFTPREQEILWKLKQLVTDPEKSRQRAIEYPVKQRERRAALSHYFENPSPAAPTHVKVEEDTVEYTG